MAPIISDESSKPAILSRRTQTAAAITKMKLISHQACLKDKADPLPSHVHIPLQLWDLDPGSRTRKKGIEALEMRCYRRFLNISYLDHITNRKVRKRIQDIIGFHDDLIMVRKWKVMRYCHKHARNSLRDNKERKTDEKIGRYWLQYGLLTKSSWKQVTMERNNLQLICPQRPTGLRDWPEVK